ncbi:MAG: RNA polymerase sigma factor [Bacteroidales bacterium]|jgi:RNA polymerase sigma-70 factor (ECF subfamily)|nr:RNA polymerase sigma factor [Bacteroidales bacterium]MDY0254593.1 RNA polymerase sigma factor [Tenuifilaceae bacterium]
MTAKEYNSCVDSFADGLYRFALKTLGDADSANDVVQDCFERLWVKHDKVDYAKAKSYLFTSAYHACIDIIRVNKRSGSMDETTESSLSTTAQYNDLQEVLHEAIKKLPDIQRSIILLRDYEGYSYEEIGQITGLNESQVKVYIYRARIALKQYIGHLETVI